MQKDQLDLLINIFIDSYQVFGPVTRRSNVTFKEISSPEEIKLDYTLTTLPPKKLFHRSEILIEYGAEGKYKAPEFELERLTLLFGVHACDLNAILRLNKFFSRDYIDSFYQRRREKTSIVVLSARWNSKLQILEAFH